MKIAPGKVNMMREMIAVFDTPERRAQYLAGDFSRADKVQDLDTRYRWDLFWLSGVSLFLPAAHKDAHIDTALRRIVPPLGVSA